IRSPDSTQEDLPAAMESPKETLTQELIPDSGIRDLKELMNKMDMRTFEEHPDRANPPKEPDLLPVPKKKTYRKTYRKSIGKISPAEPVETNQEDGSPVEKTIRTSTRISSHDKEPIRQPVFSPIKPVHLADIPNPPVVTPQNINQVRIPKGNTII